MADAAKVNNCKVISGKDSRLTYEHVWEPVSINGGNPKYSTGVLIPKTDAETVGKIRKAIEAAYHEGESKLKGSGKTVPPMSAIKLPLRDGDLERPDDPAYAGMWFVNANTDHAPGIVDLACNRILDRSEVYSGCYCRVSLSFYAFNSNGNRGIACGLNNIQKVRDGEPLGGRISAEAEFAGLEDPSESLIRETGPMQQPSKAQSGFGNGDRRIDEDFLA